MTGYVLKMFPRFSETFVLAEILEMERRGRLLSVLSLRKPDDGRFHAEVADVRARVTYLPEHLRCAPGRYVRSHLRWMRRRPARYARLWAESARGGKVAREALARGPLVADWMERQGIRRLHAHFASLPAATAAVAADLAGAPFTFTAHAKDIFHRDRSPRLLHRLLERAERVFTVSEFNRRFLLALAGDAVPDHRVVRVYNSVDLRSFGEPDPEARRDDGHILAVGRLVEKKGFDVLLEACERLRGWGVTFRCTLVGKGPEEDRLRRDVRRLGLQTQVRLAGPLPRSEVSARLRRATVLAAPCRVARDGNRDGLPTVILEAMASGLPVVAAPVTGIPEALEHERTGLLVPSEDPDALARALHRMLRDAQLRRRLAAAARKKAESVFSLERNVAQLDAWLHREDGQGPPHRTPADGPLEAAAAARPGS